MKIKTTLEEALNFDYEVIIEKIAEDDGDGYCAYLPDFGHHVIFGDGDTSEEALMSMESFKKHQFKRYVEYGIEFPTPSKRPKASGKFLLRIPKGLHGQLIHGAELNGTTLNQYCVNLLSVNYSIDNIKFQIESVANGIVKKMYEMDMVNELKNNTSISVYDNNIWGDAA